MNDKKKQEVTEMDNDERIRMAIEAASKFWQGLTDEEKEEMNRWGRERLAAGGAQRKRREEANRKWTAQHGDGGDPDEGYKRQIIEERGLDCKPEDFEIIESAGGDIGILGLRFKNSGVAYITGFKADDGGEQQ